MASRPALRSTSPPGGLHVTRRPRSPGVAIRELNGRRRGFLPAQKLELWPFNPHIRPVVIVPASLYKSHVDHSGPAHDPVPLRARVRGHRWRFLRSRRSGANARHRSSFDERRREGRRGWRVVREPCVRRPRDDGRCTRVRDRLHEWGAGNVAAEWSRQSISRSHEQDDGAELHGARRQHHHRRRRARSRSGTCRSH